MVILIIDRKPCKKQASENLKKFLEEDLLFPSSSPPPVAGGKRSTSSSYWDTQVLTMFSEDN